MKIIKEMIRSDGEKYYAIYLDSVQMRKVNVIRISKKYKGFQYIFLINSNGETIDDVFEFLNIICKEEGIGGRDQAASALKILYSYSEIINKDIPDFTRVDIKNLSRFILGRNITGNTESYIFISFRSICTHDQYLDIIRKYLSEMKICCEEFFETVKTTRLASDGKSADTERYVTNIGIPGECYSYVPPFISFKKYREIIDLIEKDNNNFKKRNKLIINLMYMRGLRIGEVLGITLEDIKTHPNNPKAGILYLRNRVSDTEEQHAKSCMKVNSVSDYKTSVYKSQDQRGFQIVSIPETLMNQIREYIDESRKNLEESTRHVTKEEYSKILKKNEADCVEDGTIKNFYLFMNKSFSPLQQGGWSKVLKKYFLNANIKIDKLSKTDNLSHRFRHGLAMYLLEDMKKDIYFIKREMRHASIQSTLVYLNPTPETILKDTEEISKSIQNKLRVKCKDEVSNGSGLDDSEDIVKSIDLSVKTNSIHKGRCNEHI